MTPGIRCSTITAMVLFSLPIGLSIAQEHGGHGAPEPTTRERKPTGPEQRLPLCPVMGEPVDFSVQTMTSDGPVYFCCDMCIPKFKNDAAKYAEKVALQRVALEQRERIQVTCPVDGEGVDGKLSAEVGGHKVAFCSQECKAEYVEHPGAFKARLAGSYTFQTRCPISGEQIQSNVFTDLSTGQRIYFCCASCGEKLLKDPAKYAPKLAEQGVMIDPKKVAPGAATPEEDSHAGDNHPQ